MIDGRIDFDFKFNNPKIYVLEIFYFLYFYFNELFKKYQLKKLRVL